MNYKLIICNDKLYKEIELVLGAGTVTVGTGKEESVCIVGDDSQTDFKISISQDGNDFLATADRGVYFKTTNASEENTHKLTPGEKIEICDNNTGLSILNMDFLVDFGYEQDNYNLEINLGGIDRFTIGSMPECDIQVFNEEIGYDYLLFLRTEAGFDIDEANSRFGAMLDGIADRSEAVKCLRNNHFFSYCGMFFYYENDILYTSDSGKVISKLRHIDNIQQINHFSYPQFIKSARQQYKDLEDKPEVLPPKNAPSEPKKNLLMILLPVILMLALMVFIRGRMMSGNKLFIVYFAASMVISGSMSVWNYINSGKDYKKKMINREKVYNEYLDVKEKELEDLRKDERILLLERNRSLQDTVRNIMDFSSKLFEKETEHEDFLDVRIGNGKVESACQVQFKKQEYVETEDFLLDYPEKIHDKYQFIEDMPVVLQLAKCNAVGVIGVRNKLYQMMKNLIVTVSGQHYHEAVKEFIIMDRQDVRYFEWVRWFKHFYDETSGRRFIIHDDDSSKAGLEFLYAELAAREALKGDVNKTCSHFVVYVYRSKKFMEHPVKEYVSKAKDLAFTFVFFEEYEEMLHSACDQRVFLEPDKNHGFIQDIHDGNKVQYFDYEHISMETAKLCAKKLAPVYIKELSLESTLTKNISFYKLLKIKNAHELDIGKRWKESKVYDSMAAPLGVKSGDEIVYLDLHEKYHGPHGLVAGTTGSGKSEILQSFILSLATLFHPYDVSFIIIDFKGGGMANQFRDLPHLNGAITNIDGKQVNRSLKSIKAELVRRQELFAKYDVNQIDNYIRLYKQGKADVPLPHLILIVDEFAELKAEQPEFMKELISTARIGRSLGVHLILATQKPAGVVNDQIWSNSKFKLCLKVQEKSDSKEVLHSPLAAEIREPGRAYLQVGNNEIFELFQSAYSGAPAYVQSTNNMRAYKISKVSLSGKREIIYEQKKEKSEESITQLEAVVEYIDEYFKKEQISALSDIILPPLPEKIPYPKELQQTGTDISVPIGIYDDPDRQAQDEFEFNFTKNHGYILGSSLSGKTMMMQSMIVGLSLKYSPKDVNIYIIDFASMMMRIFENINNVGCVVTLDEEDKLRNLVKLLTDKLASRRRLLAELGLSSYGAYREAGYTDEPQIILFIENYAVLREVYPKYEEEILTVCRDGVANGISLVISGQQMSGLGFKLMANISFKMALHCNDNGQYMSLLDRCRLYPDDVPGRGVTKFETEIKEFQSYIAFDVANEAERISEIRNFISQYNEKYKGERAEGIKYVPTDLTRSFLSRKYGDIVSSDSMMLGLNYANAEPAYIEFTTGKLLAVIGREDLGKTKFAEYLVDNMVKNGNKCPAALYIIDSQNKNLSKYKDCDQVKYYSSNVMDANELISQVYDEAKERKAITDKELLAKPYIMVVINNNRACEAIIKEDDIYEKYLELVKMQQESRVCIMFTDVDNVALNSASNPIMKQIRDEADVVIFENMKAIELIRIPPQIVNSVKAAMNFGDAFYINKAKIKRVKVPLDN